MLTSAAFEAFTAALANAPPDLAAVRAEVETAIDEGMRAGAERWPDVVVDPRGFAAAMARAFAHRWESTASLGALHVEDLYLAQACAGGDTRAIAAFDRTFQPTIDHALRALRLAEDVAGDVAQDVRERLFVGRGGAPGKIATYSGRAALASWLRTIVTRAALELGRRTAGSGASDVDDDALATLTSDSDAPDEQYFRATYHREFKAAFDDAIASLTPRQRSLLKQRFVDGLNFDAIGALYGVHKATAFRWLEEARTLVTKRTRNAFQQRTRATASEMRSILRVLESQLELSLRRVLDREPAG